MKGGVWVSGGSGGSWRSLGHHAQGQQSTSAERPEGKLGQRQVCGEESGPHLTAQSCSVTETSVHPRAARGMGFPLQHAVHETWDFGDPSSKWGSPLGPGPLPACASHPGSPRWVGRACYHGEVLYARQPLPPEVLLQILQDVLCLLLRTCDPKPTAGEKGTCPRSSAANLSGPRGFQGEVPLAHHSVRGPGPWCQAGRWRSARPLLPHAAPPAPAK